MGIFNPLYLLAPPALIIVSIPLVTFAIFTTAIAFTTLFIRLAVVYAELALALIRSYFVRDNISEKTLSIHTPPSPRSPYHRRRRSSAVSTSSSQELLRNPPDKSDSYISLLGAGAPGRDYEGVGGWRDLVDDQEESLWLGMNRRLELPMSVSDRQRRHQRSLTGGSGGAANRYSWSPETMRMSPVQSRARTPSMSDISLAVNQAIAPEEYFGLQPHGRPANIAELTPIDGGSSRRKSSSGSGERRGHGSGDNLRRKSLGGSSTSSTSSGKSSKATVKQTSWG